MQSEALSTERDALADKAKALEVKVVEQEWEHVVLQDEVRTLWGVLG